MILNGSTGLDWIGLARDGWGPGGLFFCMPCLLCPVSFEEKVGGLISFGLAARPRVRGGRGS